MGQGFKDGIWIARPPTSQLSNASSMIGHECIYVHMQARTHTFVGPTTRRLCIRLNPEIIASHTEH